MTIEHPRNLKAAGLTSRALPLIPLRQKDLLRLLEIFLGNKGINIYFYPKRNLPHNLFSVGLPAAL
jgi:hypothetical protein